MSNPSTTEAPPPWLTLAPPWENRIPPLTTMVSYDIPTGDFVYYVLKIGGYGNEGGEAVYRVGLSGGNLRLLDNMEKVPRIVSADEEAPAIPPWVRRGLRWKSIVHAYECNAMTPTAVKRKTYFVAEKAVEYYKNLNIPPS